MPTYVKQLVEGITVLNVVSQETSHVRILVEGIIVYTISWSVVVDVKVGWLGSFPKLAYASLILGINSADTGSPVSGVTVTATIYSALDGAFWRSFVMPETTTAGIYRGVFRISKKDPLGTYSVTIVATSGVLSPTTTTYTGYINVYAGTPGGIRFH